MSNEFDGIRRQVDTLAPTRAGAVRTSPEVVDALRFRAGGAGMFLGRDAEGHAVVRDLFNAEPQEVVVVGTLGFAKLVAFRALALGAQVWVETRRYAAWESFIRMSAGMSGAIQVVREFPDVGGASEERPILIVVDSDSALSEEDQVGMPWTTVLTVYAQLTQWNAGDIAQADLSILQHLTDSEVRLVGRAIRKAELQQALASLDTTSIAVYARGTLHQVDVQMTSVERYLIGEFARKRQPHR